MKAYILLVELQPTRPYPFISSSTTLCILYITVHNVQFLMYFPCFSHSHWFPLISVQYENKLADLIQIGNPGNPSLLSLFHYCCPVMFL